MSTEGKILNLAIQGKISSDPPPPNPCPSPGMRMEGGSCQHHFRSSSYLGHLGQVLSPNYALISVSIAAL